MKKNILILVLVSALLFLLTVWLKQEIYKFQLDRRSQLLMEFKRYALASTNAEEIIAAWEHEIPAKINENPLSEEQLLIDEYQMSITRQVIDHLREITRTNLGDDPDKWIAGYHAKDAKKK